MTCLLERPVNLVPPRLWWKQHRMLRRYSPNLYTEHKMFYDLMAKRPRGDAFSELAMAALYRHSAMHGAGGCTKAFWIARAKESLLRCRQYNARVLP